MSDKNTRRQALIEQYEKAWAAQERRDFALRNLSGQMIPVSKLRVGLDWFLVVVVMAGLVSHYFGVWDTGQAGAASNNLFRQAWWIQGLVYFVGAMFVLNAIQNTKLYLRRQNAYRAWQSELEAVLAKLGDL